MNALQDHKFNIRLVKTVKKYPLLYNTELKEYTRRDCRERAWIDVAEELNCDPKAVQKKWQNFRTILVRKLRQIQMGESVQQYYLYEHIKYIIPYLKKSYEPGTLKRTLKQALQNRNDETDTEYGTGSEHSSEDIELVEDLRESNNDPIFLETYEPYEMNDPKRLKIADRSEDKAGTDVDYDLVSIPRRSESLEHIMVKDEVTNCTPIQSASAPARYTEQSVQTEFSESPKRQFVLSLLPDLNEMTNSQMRQFKYKVLQLIHEILNENNT
ncbi:uncharacterized protein LOC105215002 [Zeugodacus cucurbitae]|uniref:Transcription factor Adf-1 n=1 Tax=Zeugodacus cucurbitae TaxID=28588 RepID=A0A0A1WPD1_ZEUCU|nr:uncharacterized protein LOC105215002 [Zeugodacus cucurbitae]